MWLTDQDILKKSARVHNIDAIIAPAQQMEVLTKKLDNLSQTMSMAY